MSPDVSYFGTTNARPPHRPFGLYQADRLQHSMLLGRSGTGKSTIIETLIKQDIANDRGAILLDPHGDLALRVIQNVPDNQQHRLIDFDIANQPGRYGYNPLKNVPEALIPLAVSGLLDSFRHHFGERSWGHRMEHIFRNVLYALLERGDATLPDILRMLSEKDYRQETTDQLHNPQVRYFFEVEFSKLWGRSLFEAIAPIQNKVGAYLTDPTLVKSLVEFDTAISFRQAMDDGKIVIVNLARGMLGSDTSDIIGGLITSTISVAAMSRLNLSEGERRPCYVYLDEFEHFLSPGSAGMLSEIRKVKIGLILAAQYLSQIDPQTRSSVLANVGSLVSLRIGPEDADIVGRQLGMPEQADQLLTLPNHDLFTSIMINGSPSKAFSGRGLRL